MGYVKATQNNNLTTHEGIALNSTIHYLWPLYTLCLPFAPSKVCRLFHPYFYASETEETTTSVGGCFSSETGHRCN